MTNPQALTAAAKAMGPRSCPLCGGASLPHQDSDREWHVFCVECDASTGRCYATEADAITAWNARTPNALPPISEGIVERLRFTADRLGECSESQAIIEAADTIQHLSAKLAELEEGK